MSNTATRERFLAYVTMYGTTHKFVAKAVGLHNVTVSYWLKGDRALSIETLRRINSYIDNMAKGNV